MAYAEDFLLSSHMSFLLYVFSLTSNLIRLGMLCSERSLATSSNRVFIIPLCGFLLSVFGTFIKYYKISQLIHTQSIAN